MEILKLNSVIIEMNNSREVLNSRYEMAEEGIS